jgi:hypothetical protein
LRGDGDLDLVGERKPARRLPPFVGDQRDHEVFELLAFRRREHARMDDVAVDDRAPGVGKRLAPECAPAPRFGEGPPPCHRCIVARRNCYAVTVIGG